MGKLSSYELLSKVWNECTFDEILEFGLSNGYIGSESIINAASDYSDPNKEYSDDELREIIRKADLYLLLDIIDEKYTVRDIIDGLDKDDVLDCYDADDLIDHCEYELSDKYNEEREIGYNEGYSKGYDEASKLSKYHLGNLNEDERWKLLCNEFDVGYYDENGLKKKLNEMLSKFNKVIYKKTKNIWEIK